MRPAAAWDANSLLLKVFTYTTGSKTPLWGSGWTRWRQWRTWTGILWRVAGTPVCAPWNL